MQILWNADIEEIIDIDDISGAEFTHYENDDISQKLTVIKETENDPIDFDLLVIGTHLEYEHVSTYQNIHHPEPRKI